MGALYGEQSMISKDAWTEMVSKGFDISLYAGYSAIANVNASLNWHNNETETFRSYTEERITYSRGAAPPGDGQAATWVQSTFDEPNVLSVTLEPLDSLWNLYDHISEAAQTNLGVALDAYCGSLLEEGALTSCDMPPPDPELPKPRVWSRWSNVRKGDDFAPQVKRY